METTQEHSEALQNVVLLYNWSLGLDFIIFNNQGNTE